MVASCILEALLTLQRRLEIKSPLSRKESENTSYPTYSVCFTLAREYLYFYFSISSSMCNGLSQQAGVIRGGLMFTRSVTNASTAVRKQRPLKQERKRTRLLPNPTYCVYFTVYYFVAHFRSQSTKKWFASAALLIVVWSPV